MVIWSGDIKAVKRMMLWLGFIRQWHLFFPPVNLWPSSDCHNSPLSFWQTYLPLCPKLSGSQWQPDPVQSRGDGNLQDKWIFPHRLSGAWPSRMSTGALEVYLKNFEMEEKKTSISLTPSHPSYNELECGPRYRLSGYDKERKWSHVLPGEVQIGHCKEFLHGKCGQILEWTTQGSYGVSIPGGL